MLYKGDGGHTFKVLITIGFDAANNPIEVFCADFKAGTSLHSIVMDACILFSRLLQHGDEPDDLEHSMCQPHSLLGSIASAVAKYQVRKPPVSDGDDAPSLPPRPLPMPPQGEAVEKETTQ